MFDSIKDAEKRLDELYEEVRSVKLWLKNRRDELFKEKHSVGVGDLVVTARGIFKVSAIDRHEWKWLHGFKRRKDGKFSVRPQRLYDDWTPYTPDAT